MSVAVTAVGMDSVVVEVRMVRVVIIVIFIIFILFFLKDLVDLILGYLVIACLGAEMVRWNRRSRWGDVLRRQEMETQSDKTFSWRTRHVSRDIKIRN